VLEKFDGKYESTSLIFIFLSKSSLIPFNDTPKERMVFQGPAENTGFAFWAHHMNYSEMYLVIYLFHIPYSLLLEYLST